MSEMKRVHEDLVDVIERWEVLRAGDSVPRAEDFVVIARALRVLLEAELKTEKAAKVPDWTMSLNQDAVFTTVKWDHD